MGYVLVVGESLIDVVTDASGDTVEWPGGSAANVAVALARLGRPTRFATSFADDARGRVLASHLAGAGVELAADPYLLDRTSSAAATIAADGSASYVFDLDWRLGPVAGVDDAGLAPPAFVHVCSIGAVLEPGADDVLRVLDHLADTPARVVYDVNARPAITGTGPEVLGRVEAVARRAEIVKASDEDLAVLYPTLGLDEAAARLLSLGPRAVVVTRGGEGATWFDAEEVLQVPATPVDVVDTIGAGDTFSAALIDALWDGSSPAAALEHAARAAAINVTRPGADPPTRAELAAG